MLCDAFMRSTLETGNIVEKINVASKKIAPCSACYYVKKHDGQCAYHDDMEKIMQKLIGADVIVMDSSVYVYSISAQLKTVIDCFHFDFSLNITSFI